jgi:hypothetical protein
MWMKVFANHYGVNIKNINMFGVKVPLKFKKSFSGKAIVMVRKYDGDKSPEILIIENTWHPANEREAWTHEPDFEGVSIVDVETDWFMFDDTKNGWAHNVIPLIGQKAKIAIGGDPQYQRGETSVALYTYDKYNEETEIFKSTFIDTRGRFSAKVAIYGKIVSFNR